MATGIYKIYCEKSKDFYIGSSAKCIYKRFKRHLSELKNQRHANKHLQAIYNKYGPKFLHMELLKKIDNIEVIWDIETEYIQNLNPTINKTKHAKAPMFGKKHTKQAKEKMSKNSKRHNKGKKSSKSTRLKNVISNGGSPIQCIETEEVFISIAEAADKLNLRRQNISAVLHGKLKSTGSLTFKKIKIGA